MGIQYVRLRPAVAMEADLILAGVRDRAETLLLAALRVRQSRAISGWEGGHRL